MPTKPSKFLAIVALITGGLLFLTGLAALAGFLGLPLVVGRDVFGPQIGMMAAIFLGLGCGALAFVHGFGALVNGPSRNFRLPPAYFFWIVFGLALGLGNALLNTGTAVNYVFPSSSFWAQPCQRWRCWRTARASWASRPPGGRWR